MRMRLSASRARTFNRSLAPRTLKSHRTVFPCSSGALAFASQNFLRSFGFVKAVNTECGDDLINCSISATRARFWVGIPQLLPAIGNRQIGRVHLRGAQRLPIRQPNKAPL